jgi:uncharacterized protein with GYD domain
MSTDTHPPTETQSGRERNWIYITACVLLVVLVVIALFTFSGARETRKAQDKADELIAELEQVGATPPSRDQIVRVLGDDGGAICENPDDSLKRAILLGQLSNGSGSVGSRPVLADRRAVQGELLVIKVYCPDELEDFQEFVDDLETDDVAGD